MSDLAIAKPLKLRCGLALPNRLAKADRDALPSQATNAVYSEWAKGGCGLVRTGTYMHAPIHPWLTYSIGWLT